MRLGDRFLRMQRYEKAVYWLTKASEQGQPYAQVNLAKLYHEGKGIPRDYKQALHWYTAAADQGHVSGFFGTGSMYEHGQGVAQDYVQAHIWYRLANEVSHVTVWPFRNAIESLEEKMTPEQRAEANARFREWEPRVRELRARVPVN